MGKHFTAWLVGGTAPYWQILDPNGADFSQFVGTEPYVKGLCISLTEAWRRGVLDGEEALRRRVDHALVSMFSRAA